MAGRIPQSFVDDLLSRVDIVDYIHKRVTLKKAGKNYQACCPFHDEKTPSFSVNPQKQFYYCFGCSAGGNAIGFAMDYSNLSFPEAVEQLAGEVGLEVPREASNENEGAASLRTALLTKLESADKYYRKQLRANQSAIEYLQKRGLSGEIARDFGIGVAPKGWDNLLSQLGQSSEDISHLEGAGLAIKNEDRNSHYDRFRDRIMFPIRDTRGRTIAFGGRVLDDSKPKYLNSPESPVFHKSRELYGLYECLQNKQRFEEIVVVEGYMDVIALAQYGVHNAVATLGTSVGSTHLEKLFRHVGRIIFCFDGDEAGERAAERALHAALPQMIDGRQVKFLFLPSGEDPDSIVRNESKQGFDNRLENAKPLSSYMMELAGAGGDLPDPDSRARAHAQSLPLINQLPQGAFKALMEQELLDRTGVAANVAPAILVEHQDNRKPLADASQFDEQLSHEAGIKAEREEGSTSPESNPPKRKARQSKTKTSVPAHLISLLLQHPVLAQQMGDVELPEALDDDEQLLLDLLSYLKDKSNVSLSNVWGHWMAKAPEQAQRLTELASHRILDSQSLSAASADFNQTFSRWHALQSSEKIRARIQQLNRIPFEEMSQENRSEMRNLEKKLAEFMR